MQTPSPRTRSSLIAVAVTGLTAALVVAAPLAASAHVHITPVQAEPGADDVALTFEVPNESASATTTRVSIRLPTTGTAFGEVTYQPVPGWTAKVTTAKLATAVTVDGAKVTEAPSRVDFTATGTGIGDGQEQEFVLFAGPVPDTGRLVIPVEQGYSDGTVVRWNQATPASGEEPEHPAPTLYIRDAAPADGAGGTAEAAGPTSSGTGDDLGLTGVVLAGTALLIAVLALAAALWSLLRTGGRRSV